MLVTIVIAPNADNTGPDLDRIGKVEDIPDEVARPMLDLGTVRTPTEDELAGYHASRRDEPEEIEAEPKSEAQRNPAAFTPQFKVSQGLPKPDSAE